MSVRFVQAEARIAALAEERARGDAFERVVAHFLRHDPSLGMRRVWTWLDWPGRLTAGVRAADLGIDLVAEDDLGELVGVQVKFRLDPHSHLRWEEVSTALGFRPDLFARRLIVTNATDRTANTRRATETTPNTGWVMREDLLASPTDWTGALSAGGSEAALVRVPRKPYEYQRTAIADVVASLAAHHRAQLVMACGSGKTLVTLWVSEARADERILVLVPTLLLLKQFRREWRETATLPFVDLAVCSDADTVEPDEWRVRADELGVPVTTVPATIATFLRGPGRRVVFATYASSARVADAQAESGVPIFDLVVADEAHRIAGVVSTGVHRERDLRVVLDAHRIRASRRLFATATPRVFGPAARGRFSDLEDVEVASMDDEALFGPVAHRLWFRAAVDLEVLTDYELVAVLVTDEEVARLVRERSGVVVDGKVLDAETLATLIAVRRAIGDLGLTRAITFHQTIARARAFAHALSRIDLASAAPDAEHISGLMSVDERERVLHILKEPERPTVVTNARCLTEGIDVPSLDAVAFVDPRSSAVDIVQAIGRVMRRATGKERGYVVVPVFLREADLADPEAAVESSVFAPVLDVLRALRAHDPQLTSDASRIQASLGPRDALAGGHIAGHIRLLGIGVDVDRFERALELRFVDVSAAPFEVALVALKRFAEREGHCRVPQRQVENGLRLGSWVNTRRLERKTGRLAPTRMAELEAIPGWTWDPLTDDWNANLSALLAFAAREGHTRVSRSHVEDGLRLGQWVTDRRSQRNAGRLGQERIADLEGIPGWTWDPFADDWNAGLAALRVFAAREGHARVPNNHVEGNLRLGSWVSDRRSQRNAGRLGQERIADLEGIPGWTWDPLADDWNAGLAALRAFVAREGHARVPKDQVEEGLKLGLWVSDRRTKHNAGRLARERTAELEGFPGWTWDPRADDWNANVAALRVFVAREGHARVPKDQVEEGLKLGLWVSDRRTKHNAGRLDPARIAELEAIAGWSWDALADDWNANVAALRAFVAREGHARVPQRQREGGPRLGAWVAHCRIERKTGRLDPARIAELEAIAGWTWDPRADDWNAGIVALRAFVVREGHASVSRSQVEGSTRLGLWVSNRRSERSDGRLDPARIAELEAIPGWSWGALADGWKANVAALHAFAAREGHARVPKNHVEDGLKLGLWVSDRRTKRNAGRLDQARIAELEAIRGWTWNPLTDGWNASVAALRAFVVREGHARVLQGQVEGGLRLGAWVAHCRIERKTGRLDPARIAELEGIPGWTWDPLADDWNANMAALRAFAAREGHARVPQRQRKGGLRLGQWVTSRRADWSDGRLDQARIAELEAVPGWTWDPLADDWSANMAALRAFAAREGHAQVPESLVEDGLRLGQWVSSRRSAGKAGRLAQEQITDLEMIRGWTWDPVADAWGAKMAALRVFAAREGHARVPTTHIEDGIRLGQWVANRRSARRAGRLAQERIAELEAIPGWTWDARSKP